MPVKFDKILNMLREKDTSAGADAIKGVVQYYADLPAAVSHLSEFWLVQQGSGIYLINRKPAGMYYSNGSTWASAPDIVPYFDDVNFLIYNDSDNSKLVKFSLTGLTSGNTRTYTAPDKSGTLALLDDIANQNITISGDASGSGTTAINLTVNKTTNLKGGNNTTLNGAISYQSNTDITSLLAPNITTTKKFLRETGTGTNGAAPAWDTVSASDVGLANVTNDAQIKASIGTTKGDLITFSGSATPVRVAAGASAGNLRTDGSGNWAIDTVAYLSTLAGAVLTTTDQIVAGIKNFTSTFILGTGEAGATPGNGTARAPKAVGTDVVGGNLYLEAGNGTGSGGSGDIILRTALPTVAATVTVGNNSAASGISTGLSWNHTCIAGGSKILIVNVGMRAFTTISTVTYNGLSLSRIGVGVNYASGNAPRSEQWFLLNPPTGSSYAIVVTPSGNEYLSCGAVDLSNASQTTPSQTTNTGSSTSPSITVTTGAIGGLVIDCLGFWKSGTIATINAGQTTIHNNSADGGWRGASSYKSGAASVIMGWDTTGSSDPRWAYSAISINAAGGTGENTIAEVARISKLGRMGVNVISPLAKLHVVGSEDVQQLIVKANSVQTSNIFEVRNSSDAVLDSIDGAGRLGLGIAPTADLTIKAGTAAAGTAPIKMTSGALLTAAEAGAVEFLTDKYYATITTGAVRKELQMYSTYYGEMYSYGNAVATVIPTTNTYTALGAMNISEGLNSGFTFTAGVTGAIASVADYSGTVAGTVLITVTAGHNLTTGQYVVITGTTNYNGKYLVTTVNATTFYITKAYVATNTGSYSRGASLKANTGSAGIYKANFYSSGIAAGANKVFKLEPVINTTDQDKMSSINKFATNTDYGQMTASGLLTIADGDVIYLVLKNVTDATNYTIENLNFNLVRI